MQGSLSLGKDVMDTITYYLRSSPHINGRRALTQKQVTTDSTDTIALIVNAAFLCRDLNLCAGGLTTFVNDYIITISKTIEELFKGLLEVNFQETMDNEIPKGVIFEEEIRAILRELRKLLNHADRKIMEDDKAFVWLDLLKNINGKFQEKALVFATARLVGHAEEIQEVKQKICQKLIIDTTLIELGYIDILCTEHRTCIQVYEVTRALKTILERLIALPDERTKEFIKYFHQTLPDTSFYYKISDVTATEFQTILSDMAFADNIHTKDVLGAVEKTVDERLLLRVSSASRMGAGIRDSRRVLMPGNQLGGRLPPGNWAAASPKAQREVDERMKSIEVHSRKSSITGRDVMLVHVILSDMDHFYSKFGVDPFHKFMSKFFEWVREGGRFSSTLRQVMKDIANTLSLENEDLVSKLVNEVRVFLEVVVNP